MDIPAEHVADFDRWYDEEHIPLLARVPGWVRSRRFVLKEVLGKYGTVVGQDGDEGGSMDGGSERVRKHVRVGGYGGRGREVKEMCCECPAKTGVGWLS